VRSEGRRMRRRKRGRNEDGNECDAKRLLTRDVVP
jgi:hypothetical protein